MRLLSEKLTNETLSLKEIQLLIKKLFEQIEDLELQIKNVKEQRVVSANDGDVDYDWTRRI